MLRVFFLFIPSLLIACSPDSPNPIGPAGKATDDCALCDFFDAFDAISAQAEPDTTATEASDPDTTATPTDEPDEVEVLASPFTIELVFADGVPENDRETLRRAADYLEDMILNDLPDVVLPTTYHTVPIMREGRAVDDLLVIVNTRPPSGGVSFGVEAYADPIMLREGGIPALGRITYVEGARQSFYGSWHQSNYKEGHYDSFDEQVEQLLYEIFQHELVHLLGIGIADQWFDNIRPISAWSSDPPPQHEVYKLPPYEYFYIGAGALDGFNRMRQLLRLRHQYSRHQLKTIYEGDYLPVREDQHHWGHTRAASYDILSGSASYDFKGHRRPLSVTAITRGALRDLGYEVAEVDSIVSDAQHWTRM